PSSARSCSAWPSAILPQPMIPTRITLPLALYGPWSPPSRRRRRSGCGRGPGSRRLLRAVARPRHLVVAPRIGIARQTVLGGAGDVVHLARAHVMQLPPRAVVVARLEVVEGGVHGRPQQRVHVAVFGPVGMHLDEGPVRTPFDMDAGP